MSDTTRFYAGKEIDINYDDQSCIHADVCVRGLSEVFDRVWRPWIQPDGARADEIAAVIAKCPSGALHFIGHEATNAATAAGNRAEPEPIETDATYVIQTSDGPENEMFCGSSTSVFEQERGTEC